MAGETPTTAAVSSTVSSAAEPELDDPSLVLIHLFELLNGPIERERVQRIDRRRRLGVGVVQRDMNRPAAMLVAKVPPRVTYRQPVQPELPQRTVFVGA